MHFCADEVMVIVSALPLIPWLLSRVVWWRARRKGFVAGGQESCATLEVRECRGCGTEIERKI